MSGFEEFQCVNSKCVHVLKAELGHCISASNFELMFAVFQDCATDVQEKKHSRRKYLQSSQYLHVFDLSSEETYVEK